MLLRTAGCDVYQWCAWFSVETISVSWYFQQDMKITYFVTFFRPHFCSKIKHCPILYLQFCMSNVPLLNLHLYMSSVSLFWHSILYSWYVRTCGESSLNFTSEVELDVVSHLWVTLQPGLLYWSVMFTYLCTLSRANVVFLYLGLPGWGGSTQGSQVWKYWVCEPSRCQWSSTTVSTQI